MTPTTWECPGCALTLDAAAVAAAHQCPGRRGRWVDFVPTLFTEVPTEPKKEHQS